MAIAFGRSAALSDSGTTPIGPQAITINAGETVVVHVTFNPTTCAVTGVSDSGGSVYTKRGEFVQASSIKIETWSTAAGGAVASTTVSVAFSGTSTDSGIIPAAYTGVLGIGAYTSNGGTGANPSLAITTQDANNFVAAGYGSLSGGALTAGTGNLRQSDADISIQQAFVDNTAASATSVTCSITLSAAAWAGGALELRSVAAAGKTPWDRAHSPQHQSFIAQ